MDGRVVVALQSIAYKRMNAEQVRSVSSGRSDDRFLYSVSHALILGVNTCLHLHLVLHLHLHLHPHPHLLSSPLLSLFPTNTPFIIHSSFP